jgi:hypothetical protein
MGPSIYIGEIIIVSDLQIAIAATFSPLLCFFYFIYFFLDSGDPLKAEQIRWLMPLYVRVTYTHGRMDVERGSRFFFSMYILRKQIKKYLFFPQKEKLNFTLF